MEEIPRVRWRVEGDTDSPCPFQACYSPSTLTYSLTPKLLEPPHGGFVVVVVVVFPEDSIM